MNIGISHAEPEAFEKFPLGSVLDVGVEFILVWNRSLRGWVYSIPPVNPEGVSAQACETKTREIVRGFHHKSVLARPIEILHLDAGIARVATPGTLHIGSLRGMRVSEGEDSASVAYISFGSDLVRSEG